MVDIFSVLLVGSVVTYFMYQNINKVTSKIEQKIEYDSNDFAKFAIYIQEKIREIKRDIDSDIECKDPRFCKKDECNEMDIVRELNDLIRKASKYESSFSKKIKRSKIEADFIEILEKLEDIVGSSCINGEDESQKLLDEIDQEYRKLIG